MFSSLSVSVIIMCMHSILVGGEQQATFLLKAQQMGLTSGKYVFVPYDTLHYSVPYANVSYFPLQNNSRLREAYDAVLTITMASEPSSFNEAFAAAQRSEEVTLAVQPEQVEAVWMKDRFTFFFHNKIQSPQCVQKKFKTNMSQCELDKSSQYLPKLLL